MPTVKRHAGKMVQDYWLDIVSAVWVIHDDEDQGERSTGLRGPVAHRGPFIPFSHMSIEVSLPKKRKNLEKNQCF